MFPDCFLNVPPGAGSAAAGGEAGGVALQGVLRLAGHGAAPVSGQGDCNYIILLNIICI